MKQYKLNWKFWSFITFFGVLTALGFMVTSSMFSGGVVDENGEELGLLIPVLMTLILSTWLISLVNLIRLYIKNKGCGMFITDKGIESTFVFGRVFAFIIALPVRLIPWEAIKECENEIGYWHIRVNKNEIEAGFLSKLIISIVGFSFCKGFIKTEITEKDIEKYRHRFSLENKK